MNNNTDQKRVAVIGLGAMGHAIASRLLQQGFAVTVYNRTEAKAASLVKQGAELARSAAEASANGLVLSVVSDDDAVRDIVYGGDGILAGLSPGGLHVSLTTLSVPLAASLAEDHQAVGKAFVAAPMLGRPSIAAIGKLFLLTSGPRSSWEQAVPVFDTLAQKTFSNQLSAAQVSLLKLSVNFLISCAVEGLGEAVALCESMSIDRSTLIDLLTSSVFTCPVYKLYGELLRKQDFLPVEYAFSLGAKDNGLVLAAAEALQVQLPLAKLVREQIGAAENYGLNDQDWSALGQVASEHTRKGSDADCSPTHSISDNKTVSGRLGALDQATHMCELSLKSLHSF